MRASLLTKLIAAYLAPTLALVILAPLVGYAVARDSLEAEVGKRLVSVASAAAATLKADLVLTLQPGDEGTRTYRNARSRLEALRVGANAERLYVIDRQRRLLVGTGDALPVGSPVPALERDRLEIDRALGGEGTPSSVTFRGLDGRSYKSGYAPLLDGDTVVGAVGADASAEFFDVLRRFGVSMVALAVLLAATGLALFLVIGSCWIVAPVRALLGSAERIGAGDLASPVPAVGTDELASLAQGMEKMRARLFDRERELQMMLAGIAHEVRNPLGGIALFAGLLAEELAGDAEKLSHVRRVQKELACLGRVVDEFLGFAREPKLALEAVPLAPLLHEVADLVRPEAETARQTVVVQSGDVFAYADAGALRRALLNLARNAVQAAPEGGRVTLAATRQGDRVFLSVEDDGPGVPCSERDRLFSPFHTTKQKGLGLGLALVRRIAEAHGGTARLEPSSRGARFVVEVPADTGALFASREGLG